MKTNILLIEDEHAIAETILYALRTDGFFVEWVNIAHKGLQILQSQSFDLVLLDVGLPDQNGFEVIKAIHAIKSLPVIFLTARSEEIDRVVGLEIGADDYIVKPFSPRKLVARIKAVLRRQNRIPVQNHTQSNLLFCIDEEKCQIYYLDHKLDLSNYEYKILKTLLAKPGRVFSREQLMSAAWDDPLSSQDRTIDSHIKNIRNHCKGIHAESDPIQTHRGLGYSLKESS